MFVRENQLSSALPFMEDKPSWNVLDASKTQRFMECPRAFFYEYILGWRPEMPSNHLVFGEAWHQALEFCYINGFDQDTIIEAFSIFLKEYRKTFSEDTDEIYSPKTPYNAAKALALYAQNYKNDNFDVLATEIGGRVSISDNFSLTFRMDGLCYDPGKNCKFVLEHKTTKSVARQWADQWSLSFQVGTYTHALHCMYPEDEVAGVIVNGTCFQKRDIKFMRVPIYKTLNHMNAWLADALYWANSIKREFYELSDSRDSDSVLQAFPRNPVSCTKYFGCPYHDFCCIWSNPLQRCDELPLGFMEDHWNPLDREVKKEVSLDLPGGE
jgi:hypothetical protein